MQGCLVVRFLHHVALLSFIKYMLSKRICELPITYSLCELSKASVSRELLLNGGIYDLLIVNF